MEDITSFNNATQKKGQQKDLTQQEDDSYLDDSIEQFIVKKDSTIDGKDTTNQDLFEQVVGLETAKEILLKSQNSTMGFSTNNTILLYGPPGCGKTYLANRFCSASQKTFFYIQSSQFLSTHCLSPDVLIKNIFESARKHKPSIVFLDDIDLITTDVVINEYNSERIVKIRSMLFHQISEVLYEDKDAITVIGATSLPWRINSKIRRLFQQKAFLNIPNQEDRLQILNLSLKSPHNLTEEQKQLIAASTESYSASDIIILVRDACLSSVRELTKATHFIEHLDDNGKTKFTPYFGNEDQNAKQMKWTDIKEDMIDLRQIDYSDFQQSLLNVRSSISQQEIDQFVKFNEEFGTNNKQIV